MPGKAGRNSSKSTKNFLSSVSGLFSPKAPPSAAVLQSLDHADRPVNADHGATPAGSNEDTALSSTVSFTTSSLPISKSNSGLYLTPKIKTILQGIHEFLKVVEKSADAFPLLKCPVAAINACIRAYELVSENREEVEHQLEQLRGISELLVKRAEYGVRPLIPDAHKITSTLDRATMTLHDISSQGTMEQYANSAEFTTKIRMCYRDVTASLWEFQLQLGLQQERTTLDILKEAVLGRLETSKDAPYTSASFDDVERQGCTPGTRQDILDQILQWAKSPDPAPSLFWLYGLAGIGKTAIALSLCESLTKQDLLASSYFCSIQLDSRNSKYIIPTIARHLASLSRAFAVELVSQLQLNPDLAHAALRKQLDGLLYTPWISSAAVRASLPPRPLLVVIDALDECDRGVEFLAHLLDAVDRGGLLGIRFLVTSRPVQKLIEKWQSKAAEGHQIALHDVERHIVDRDIRHYLRTEFDGLRGANVDTDIDALVSASGGLFIFAATVVKYIFPTDSELTPVQQIRRLQSIQSQAPGTIQGIDELYIQIVNAALPRRERPTQDQLKEFEEGLSVLHAIISLAEPQPAQTIAALVAVDLDIVRSVVSALHSVLYIAADGRIHIFHVSFRDFLNDKKRSSYHHCVTHFINLSLAVKCLQTLEQGLRFNICCLESSFIPDDELIPPLAQRISQYIGPLLAYSCKHWWEHCKRCEKGGLQQLYSVLRSVLREQGIFWIEIMSLLGHLQSCKSILEGCTSFAVMTRTMPDIPLLATKAAEVVSMLIAIPPPRSTSHLYISALATWKEDAILQRWKSQFTRIPRVLQRQIHTRQLTLNPGFPVECVAFSPDVKRIASGSNDCTIRIWDAETGEEVWRLKGHTDSVDTVAFSPDSKLVVSGSSDETIRLWDIESGEEVYCLEGHTDVILSLAFSYDGKQLLSGSGDCTICAWDVEVGEEIRQFKGHTDMVLSVAYSSNGKRVASCSNDETIRVWDVEAGNEIHRLPGHTGWVYAVSFSSDGHRVFSCSEFHAVRIWDIEVGDEIQCDDSTMGNVTSVAFSSDCRHVVSGSKDHTIWIRDVEQSKWIHCLDGHSGSVYAVAFSPDGKQVLSGSSDGTIRIWDLEAREGFHPFDGQKNWVSSVAFSPDCKRIASGSYDQFVRIWDIETGEEIRCFEGHTQSVNSVAFSSDGKRVVSGSLDQTIRLWDIQGGKEIHCFDGHTESVSSVSFSSDGRQVLSSSSDGTIRIWNLESEKDIHVFEGHTTFVEFTTFSPDEKRVLSCSGDHTVRIWDIESDQEIRCFENDTNWILSVAFSPDGHRVLSCSEDETISTWDMETCKEINKIYPSVHTPCIESVAFFPRGNRIAFVSQRTIIIRDIETGAEIHPLNDHTHLVVSVAFSLDGKQVVSGSSDGTIHIFDAEWENVRGYCPFSTVIFSSPQSKLVPPSKTIHLKPTGVFYYTRDDGWVVTSKDRTGQEEKLLWLPPSLRPFNPPILHAFSKVGFNSIDLTDCIFGSGWTRCYVGYAGDVLTDVNQSSPYWPT